MRNDDFHQTDATDSAAIPSHEILDRQTVRGGLSWWMIWGAVALGIAVLLRLVRLDAYSLSPLEGRFAFQGWAVFQGEGAYGPGGLPDMNPVVQLAVAFSLFLSGASDVTARLAPAAAGIGMLLLVPLLRPVARPATLVGLLLTIGLSPSLVYFSRTIDPAIFQAFFTMVLVVANVRASTAESPTRLAGWAAVSGFGMAGLIGSGPAGISVLLAGTIAIVISMVASSSQRFPDALGVGARRIVTSTGAITALVGSLTVTLLLIFTRLLSDTGAISGLVNTFEEWARIIGTRPTTTPTQFFLWATLLYEVVAIVLLVVALLAPPLTRTSPGIPNLRGSTFATWFGVALVLQSLSSGREPEQFVLVSLPLVLAAGIGLGRILERIERFRMLSSIGFLAPFSALAMLIGIIAILMAVARANDPGGDAGTATMEIIIILLLVLVPFSAVLARSMSMPNGGTIVRWSALLVLVTVLGVYGVRSASMLAWERSELGTEMLAENTSTGGVIAITDQVKRISRDLTVGEATNIDPTGRYGISIALSPEVADPYRWYFREFPESRVATPANWEGADVVFAPSPENMAEQGFIVQGRGQFNRVPPAYQGLSSADILSHFVDPSKWHDGIRFLLYRENLAAPPPEQVAIGYTAELNNQVNPALGPFNLTDDPGRGSALGQLDTPVGIAHSPDGEVFYVVNSNNLRIDLYSADGEFVAAWSGEADPNLTFASAFNSGPTGIDVSEDGLIYVADTWNHRVVVIDSAGQFIREIGQRGGQTNLEDSPDPTGEPGLFFGPRDIATVEGEIYVTDTGNERVQVFASDGTFLRAFGGYGTEPGKLIEPVGITIGMDDRVYVADSGNGRLSVFERDGEPVTQIPIPAWEGQTQQVNYLATGPDGRVYMTSPSSGTVEVFDPNAGEVVQSTSGPDDAELEQPIGISVLDSGEVLVTDGSIHGVVRFDPELPGAQAPASPVATPEAG